MIALIWLFFFLFYPAVILLIGVLLLRRGWSLPSTLAVGMGSYFAIIVVLYALIGF